MLYGLYLSAQGAEAQSTRLNVIANNIANAQTSAFKRDLAVFRAQHPHDVERGIAEDVPGNLNDSTGGIVLDGVVTDFSDGPMIQTGGTYDLAIQGPGFMRVSNGEQEFLTRNGSLAVNDVGELVTQDLGYQVLDSGGAPISIIPEASDVEITSDGRLNFIDSQGFRIPGGQIDLVKPDSFDQLVKIGNSMYRTEGETESAVQVAKFNQRYLEGSGTQSVMEMLKLIEASRAFESNVNMIKAQDEALGQLLQSAARQ